MNLTAAAAGVNGSARESPTKWDDTAGSLRSSFYRPFEDDGTLSDEFAATPIEAATVELDAPIAIRINYGSAHQHVNESPMPIPDFEQDHSGPAVAAPNTIGDNKQFPTPIAWSNGIAAPPTSPPSSAQTPSRAVSLHVPADAPLEDVPPWIMAISAIIIAVAVAAAFYHRIVGAQLREHPRRADILSHLQQSPGLSAAELATRMGLHTTSVTHHLRRMVLAGILTTRSINGRARYGLAGQATPEALAHAVLLRTPVVRALLAIVDQRPGITISEAARALDVTRFALRLQVGRLKDEELLRVQRVGTSRRLYANTRPE